MNQIPTLLASTPVAADVARYGQVRAYTEELVVHLTAADQGVQSMTDASPAKWHRAHTTWFFEQFVLGRAVAGYRVFDPEFEYLFNSYYDAVGPRLPQPLRGSLCATDIGRIGEYRRHVDAMMRRVLPTLPDDMIAIVETGLQHEQQHQELLVTDTLHAYAGGLLASIPLPGWQDPAGTNEPMRFVDFAGGLIESGHRGGGFCFDNEMPRHRVFLAPYRLASRLVRNEDWLEFMADGGYRKPALWMSDGWELASREKWAAPLYWRNVDGEWHQMGPGGLTPLIGGAAVRHISWYEADAYARWARARLPTEAEWEAADSDAAMREMTGHVWQWTASAYSPYPGFRPADGALGEYNGKFMINRMVLRGGSVATPAGHARPTYRNFFCPDRRWQFSGVRLAQDA